MKWSKLKQRIEDGFAVSVMGRAVIWTTRTRKAHDQFGEAWITLDGERLHSMGSVRVEIDVWQESHRLRGEAGLDPHESWSEAERRLHGQGNMGLWSVNAALFGTLSMPFEAILA